MPRFESQILYKKEIKPKIYLLILGASEKLNYSPGQFVSLEFEPKKIRAYSIVNLTTEAPKEIQKEDHKDETYITLLISTKPGGEASKFFEKVEVGAKMNSIGPAGRYGLKDQKDSINLIATGTGIAPFIPMAETILNQDNAKKVNVFFGTQFAEDNFVEQLFEKYTNKQKYPNFNLHVCFSQDSNLSSPNHFFGRVTKVLTEVVTEYENADFYICGNPSMVNDVEEILKSKNANSIYSEKYGK